MSKNARKYTAEYKAEALKLALSSSSVSGAAKDLGMPEATLHTWVTKAKALGEQQLELKNGDKTSVNVGEILEENQQLRKRLARLEQEKDILKKATAFFVRESK
jgi:transposase